MKKIALSILLVAALCMVALVVPVSAAAASNPANAGLNSTSPFWFPDLTYSSGKTLAAALPAPALSNKLTVLSGKTVANSLPAPTVMNKLTVLSGKTVANSLPAPTASSKLTVLSGKTVANSFPAITKVKYSTGGYFYF